MKSFITVHVASDRCRLYCQAANHSFYFALANKVEDGTPCDHLSRDVCIEGICYVRVMLSLSSSSSSISLGPVPCYYYQKCNIFFLCFFGGKSLSLRIPKDQFSSPCPYLSPVSPIDNIFALPAEVFSSCLAIVSAVMVGELFLWPALRYETGYHQTV